MTSTIDHTVSSAGIISNWESEQFVEHLEAIPLDSVGGPKWRRIHEYVEKLNLQAHHNALTKREEFVVEQIISHSRASVLVTELLSIELWKEKVFPLVRDELAKTPSIMAYTLLYHEASILNLLECIMFHKEVVLSLAGTDALFELVDYCHRKMVLLVANPNMFRPDEVRGITAKHLASRSAQEELDENLQQIQFGVCMIALSVFRFITDHLDAIPINVLTRILNTNDMIGVLVPLIERQPWLCRQKSKAWKWVDGKWSEIEPHDIRRLCQPEAQVWLALTHLLCDPEARSKYDYDTHRKDVVARLRNYFSEALLDQIPPLQALQRAVEEVQILAAPEAAHRAGLVIEQVPVLRESMLRNNFDKLAQGFVDMLRSQTDDDRRREIEAFATLYSHEAIEDVLEKPICANCGRGAVKRCSRCKMEWYCGRECQVKAWTKHKTVCDLLVRK